MRQGQELEMQSMVGYWLRSEQRIECLSFGLWPALLIRKVTGSFMEMHYMIWSDAKATVRVGDREIHGYQWHNSNRHKLWRWLYDCFSTPKTSLDRTYVLPCKQIT